MRVAVGMSGGVDSSVCALLMKEKGYEVIGITLRFHKEECENDTKVCCSPQDVRDAVRVSQMLGIPHITLDWEEIFKKLVIDEFIKGYSQGITPNPCAICNRDVKTGFLANYLKKVADIDKLATGHYARIVEYKGFKLIAKGKDTKKDQSYFLALIRAQDIELLEFPLGDFTKEEVREIAKSRNLPVAQKSESQDVCFLKGKPVGEFLKSFLKEREGFFIYKNQVAGKHKGIYQYTIGQRKGLGIALGKPVYVVKIDPVNNIVYLGDEEDLLSDTILLKDVNFHLPIEYWEDVYAQVRYKSKMVKVKEIQKESECYKITLESPIKNITPGQVCAFYQNDILLGGGIIQK